MIARVVLTFTNENRILYHRHDFVVHIVDVWQRNEIDAVLS